jgi:hypothetical protein
MESERSISWIREAVILKFEEMKARNTRRPSCLYTKLPYKKQPYAKMKPNLMYRPTANFWLTIGLPVASILFIVFGLQATPLVAELLVSIAAVGFLFSAFLYLPYFFEQHARMRAVYARYDALQAAGRIRAQRMQYYTLNRALSRHQFRGRNQLVALRTQL